MSTKSGRDLYHHSIIPCTCKKGERVGQRQLLVRRETNERGKEKEEDERRKSHKVTKGRKLMRTCDRQAMYVKITANTHKLQMLLK